MTEELRDVSVGWRDEGIGFLDSQQDRLSCPS